MRRVLFYGPGPGNSTIFIAVGIGNKMDIFSVGGGYVFSTGKPPFDTAIGNKLAILEDNFINPGGFLPYQSFLTGEKFPSKTPAIAERPKKVIIKNTMLTFKRGQ
jgi:hypothetical protein